MVDPRLVLSFRLLILFFTIYIYITLPDRSWFRPLYKVDTGYYFWEISMLSHLLKKICNFKCKNSFGGIFIFCFAGFLCFFWLLKILCWVSAGCAWKGWFLIYIPSYLSFLYNILFYDTEISFHLVVVDNV